MPPAHALAVRPAPHACLLLCLQAFAPLRPRLCCIHCGLRVRLNVFLNVDLQIIKRFEAKGYHLRGLKFMNVPRELAEEHYVDLKSKPFYGGLVEYICR